MKPATDQQSSCAGRWGAAALEILRRRSWLPLAVFLAHETAAHLLDLYRAWPPIDIPLHLAGGLAMAFVCGGALETLHRRRLIFLPCLPCRQLLTLALVCAAALAWEFAEWTADHTLGTACQLGLDDTMLDLACGVAGGIAYLVLTRAKAPRTPAAGAAVILPSTFPTIRDAGRPGPDPQPGGRQP